MKKAKSLMSSGISGLRNAVKRVMTITDDCTKSFEEQVLSLMGDHKLELDDSRRDVILVIGRSGVGKSTLTEIIFGDIDAMESVWDDDLACFKIKNTKQQPGQAEHNMFQSNTICPQLFIDSKESGLAIYDCPGFADTRGTSNEIATGVYLSGIIQHAARVKLVATVDYDTVKPHGDRNKFTDYILPEVLDFVQRNDIYDGGVFLLVTKYANPSDPSNRLSEDRIVKGIVNYLEQAQEFAARNAGFKRQAAINALFEKSWLKKVDGTYPNIGFSRTINSDGKLGQLEHLTRREHVRNQLLNNPHFVFKPSDREHFGCPISDTAKLEIREAQKKLCGEADVQLRNLGQKVIAKFTESAKHHEEISKFVHEYNVFLDAMNHLPPADSGLTVRSLEILRKFGNDIGVNRVDLEINWLKDIVKCLKHLSSVDVEASAAIWRDANGKLDRAKESMAKDLINAFRFVQRDLQLEVNTLLESLRQKVLFVVVKSADSSVFKLFDEFSDNLKKLTKEQSGLRVEGLEILRELGKSTNADIDHEVDKLTGISGCLKYLTDVDVQMSSTTWADVDLKWNHAVEFMRKDVAQLKAQRDIAEAKAQGDIAVAKAEAELEASKAKGELAQAKALQELAEAKAEAIRAEAKAKEDLLLAELEKEKADAKAKEETREAEYKAELAKAKAETEEAKKSGCSIQ